MKNLKLFVLLNIFCYLFTSNYIQAQDFIMQGWYWDYPKTTDGKIWADTLKDKAQELSKSGFTYIWLPPLSRTSYGNSSNGYDVRDLFDLGEYGQGTTQFGTRADVDELIDAFTTYGINAIADVVYNHRDGGLPESNGAVEGWIENYNSTKVNNGDNPYPSDRFRCILTIGGSTGYGTGDYYFKIKSMSGHSNFYNKKYKVYMWTNRVGWKGLPDINESEPNGGGDCGEGNNDIPLGVNLWAWTDDDACLTDEFRLALTSDDFYSAGDTIYIVLANENSNYSDHYIYGIWYSGTSSDIQSSLICQTYTDFTQLPSNRGGMTYMNFKPNGNPTQLSGDWDWPWFYYDYDQTVQSTKDTLFEWTKWLCQEVGINGLRMDAVKHFNPEFLGDLFDYLHDNAIDPGVVVGEYYDGNSSALKSWIDNVYAYMDTDTKSTITPRVFDFSLRFALENACDLFGYDARNLFTSSVVDAQGMNGYNVVTFTDNHDFRSSGQPIDNDPILAYAYILTNNQIGLPCIYYPDYYENGLKNKIDQLIKVHKKYIYGSSSREYLNRSGTTRNQYIVPGYGYATTTLIYQLMNTPSDRDVIVAINFAGGTDTLKVYQEVNTSNFSSGQIFTDVIGNSLSRTITINGNNEIYIELPPRSYSVWVQGEVPIELDLKIFLQGAYR
ncbi:MAG: DUF1939 domain-containing protein [Ignavibacteriales bacterium]|nr:DUF1939 domain-containing protein [Ignavibacteriales bacterium]